MGSRSALVDRSLRRIFRDLDYHVLGTVYCHEGGDQFWRVKRGLCQRLGKLVARALLQKLQPNGRSLYVGAGVAELPVLVMEMRMEKRTVAAYNLRSEEAAVLNRACHEIGLEFRARDAVTAQGRFDHLWIVSVLNDPERFPNLSPLSYGRADPLTFNSARFDRERRIVRRVVDRCMAKLTRPGLVTTTTEEVVWIAEYCHRHKIPYLVGGRQYATALVGDPICFIRIGKGNGVRVRGQKD